jgi:cob(I)alamin adenosyltransferase
MARRKFFSGTGDQGKTTRLGGQSPIKKSSLLIDALGVIDEATSSIGVARAAAQSRKLCDILTEIQHHLIALMAHLSATWETRAHHPGLSNDEVAWLEERIAELEKVAPLLSSFVLPGDSPAGAALHVARTVVRRAERRLVALIEEEPDIGQANLAYINRLSSLLFVAALTEDQTNTITIS